MSHKEWRRIAKKERRRRLRRAAAQQHDDDEKQLRAALERSAEYLKWRDEQERLMEETLARERQEHEEREKQWLEEEVRAQKEWQVLQQKKEEERQKQLEQQMKMAEELEVKKEAFRKKEEEHRRKRKELLRKREQLQKDIKDYVDNGAKTPEALREVSETQPGKELCPFFMKTGACRYGDKCSKNHRIVFLSKVILIHGFYSHFSLEKNSAEYDTDVTLEYENSETWQHYREFYEDIISELKTYGRINVLRCCCNTEAHLRGNLYVEYHTEREATRAWRKLNGRWYAGKQLKCEFANLKSWRNAICGMTKCPKGTACNYLHTFRNPRNEYSTKEARHMKNTPQRSNSKRSSRRKSRWEESVRSNGQEECDWRWSESPEIELEPQSKDVEEKRCHVAKKKRSHRSSHDGKRERSESSLKNLNSSSRSSSPEEHHRSKSRKRGHDNEETTSDSRSSKKRKKKSKRRSDNKNGHKKARRKS